LEWIKFSTVAWTKDNSGFFYSRYDQPKTESEFTGANYFQKLFYHKVGTAQADDILVYQRSDEKEWGFRSKVSDDGAFLIVSVWRGTERKNQIFYAPIEAGKIPTKSDFVELLRGFVAEYEFLGNDGDLFYFETDRDAPKRRIIAIDRNQSDESKWKTIVPETSESIEGSSLLQDKVFVTVLQDATSVVRRYLLDGTRLEDLAIPGLGTVTGFEGKRTSKQTFFSFTNYITPPATYAVDVANGSVKEWRAPKVAFEPNDYVTERTFYTSKDGTRIPLILSYKKGFRKDGSGRAFLYAYGGFNISITPTFSPANLAWMEQGGLYAVANIRGGGEYGREWHESAMLDKKQNCFDDFISAAEFLIANRYTNSQRLAVHGRSNGGLLIGAVMAQRPDLFAVAIPGVGVMDMLRFQKFTIGWAWVSEFGSSDNAVQFKNLLSYSPLHNLRPGTRYPATMVTTADHDDRVVPGHSFKFAARLQACQSGDKPALIRIETSAGHGAGTPVSKLIEAAADMWAFVLHNTREPSKP
jgi:prolyl oligopeptidase